MLNNIGRICRNNFVRNGIWLYLLQIFNTIVPLLTLPYVTRIFGAEKYGAFSIAFNIYGYIQVIIEYSFPLSATRKMSLDPQNMLMAQRLFSSVFLARLLLSSISIAFAVLYAIIHRNAPEQSVCLIIMSVCSLGYCMQINWFFQGIQNMKYISLTTMIARSFMVICTFVFIRSQDNIYLYSFFMTILPLIYGSIGFIIANRKYSLHFVKVPLKAVLLELKDGFLVFTTLFSSRILSSFGITLLGIFASQTEVGIYSAIQKIPNILMLAWLPIGQILYPIASKKMTNSFIEGKSFVYRLRNIVISIFAFGVIIISFLSKEITKIAFGQEYAAYHYWAIPLLVWMLLSINNNFLGHQILVGGNFDKAYSKCFQIAVCASVAINFVLIYFFKGNGAAFAPLLSEIVLTFLELREIYKLEKTS